ncbi:hypothetical protein Tco_1557039 [Tanacetum coccineum]
MKNNSVCKENGSNVFRKEREQYHEIQDLKAQMQDKNIAISELKKLIEKCKGKSVETQFDKPSVVRQPNAQRIPKPSVLGKPTPFSNSPEMRSFQTKQSVNKTNVSDDTSFNGQKQQRIDLNADALYNEKQENIRVWLLKLLISKKPVPEWPPEKTYSSQQGLEFLFSSLLEDYYNPTHGLAEENNNNQAPNASIQQDDFFNPFCTRTIDHPLEQVCGNPTMTVQTRRQLATDPKMCMFALTVSIVEPKNIKEAMADSAWIEAMQDELIHSTD